LTLGILPEMVARVDGDQMVNGGLSAVVFNIAMLSQ